MPVAAAADHIYTQFNSKANLIKPGFSQWGNLEQRRAHYRRLDGWTEIAIAPGSKWCEDKLKAHLRALGFVPLVGTEYFYASEKLLKAMRDFGWPIGELLKARARRPMFDEKRSSRGLSRQQNLFGNF